MKIYKELVYKNKILSCIIETNIYLLKSLRLSKLERPNKSINKFLVKLKKTLLLL